MLTMQIGNDPAVVRAGPCGTAVALNVLPSRFYVCVVAFCDGWVQLSSGGWLSYAALSTEQESHA